MATYTKRDIHTSPKIAGRQNLEGKSLPTDPNKIMWNLIPIMEHGIQEDNLYHGQWTDEEFEQSVQDFFYFCQEKELKPVRPALQLWLRVCKERYLEWLKKPDQYKGKSRILQFAEELFEVYLQINIDKYPAGSIFLLKTSHGHVETSRLDVTNSTNEILPEQIEAQIAKLGLESNTTGLED